MLTARDRAYWIWKEKHICSTLVDMAAYGFPLVAGFKKPMRVRPLVAEALAKAKTRLPARHTFKLYDAWRPWARQEKIARLALQEIRAAHPGWTHHQVKQEQWKMAPPQRVLTKFGSHRFGGAVDLTIVDQHGRELNMGVPVDYLGGEKARLLFYDLKPALDSREKRFRDNRRLLITAMEHGGFQPYLAEFWHWGYDADIRE
jgi:D-alanyl-D-alanine dipeptidase